MVPFACSQVAARMLFEGGGQGNSLQSYGQQWPMGTTLSSCLGLGNIGKVSGERYHEPPMSITKLRLLLHFGMGCHSLPIEQGRLGNFSVPRHLRRCTLCTARAVGDERHCVFDCPCFCDLCQEHARLFDDAHCAMRCLMWHKDQ